MTYLAEGNAAGTGTAIEWAGEMGKDSPNSSDLKHFMLKTNLMFKLKYFH